MCRQRRVLARSLAGATAALLLLAADGAASEIGLRFDSREPGTRSAMALHIRYFKPGDPQAKPSPIRRIRIDAPAGTVFDKSRVATCEATDGEIMVSGPGACPDASRIAGGTIVVTTGFGPPADPFASPTPVFNDGNGWLEVSQTPPPSTTIAVTRLAVRGSRISGDIAATPGGPPDFQSAVSTLDLSFPAATGYVVTPPSCPPGGQWVTTGTFGFADGTTEVVTGTTPCETPEPTMRVRLVPAGVRSGVPSRVAIVVASSARHCVTGVAVRIAGRRTVRTDSSGRASLPGTFQALGRRFVTASKPGCQRASTWLAVR